MNQIQVVNRALPALPLDLCLDLPAKISFKPNSRTEISHRRAVSSATSFTSANSSVKQQFQDLTRKLVLSSEQDSLSILQDQSDPLDSLLDPIKYDPSEQSKQAPDMLSASQSYRDISDLNPFLDYRHSSAVTDYNHDPKHLRSQGSGGFMGAAPAKICRKPKGMCQSRSESHLNYRSPSARLRTSPFRQEAPEFRSNHVKICDKVYCSPISSPNPHHIGSRTPSPKKLNDIKEDQLTDFSTDLPTIHPSPTRRPRSPVKQLFGDHGWLGRSTSMKELPSDVYRKTGFKHWGEKLKQRVEEIVGLPVQNTFILKMIQLTLCLQIKTDEMYKKLHAPGHLSAQPVYSILSNCPPKYPTSTGFPISLTPPEQAKLYSEIELMICATANHFLKGQQYCGHIAPSTIGKITQGWASKNRPQVIEFRYDQQTQRDLVLYNMKTLKFRGPDAENPIVLNSMMHSWKHLGKDMSVRTFCAPDSVVRKHMYDIYKVLEMLGAPDVMFLAYKEIQKETLKLLDERQTEKDDYRKIMWGLEKAWEPQDDEIVPGRGRSGL